MDRRTFIKGAVISASPPAAIGAISMSIPDMYKEWLEVRNRDNSGMTDAEDEADFARYCDLQDRIVAADPQTPRDVAIQFLVDTDDMDGDVTEGFLRRLRQLALE